MMRFFRFHSHFHVFCYYYAPPIDVYTTQIFFFRCAVSVIGWFSIDLSISRPRLQSVKFLNIYNWITGNFHDVDECAAPKNRINFARCYLSMIHAVIALNIWSQKTFSFFSLFFISVSHFAITRSARNGMIFLHSSYVSMYPTEIVRDCYHCCVSFAEWESLPGNSIALRINIQFCTYNWICHSIP